MTQIKHCKAVIAGALGFSGLVAATLAKIIFGPMVLGLVGLGMTLAGLAVLF